MAALGGLASGVVCRQIEAADREGVVACLVRGFETRPERYWQAALDRLSRRPQVDGLPRYGYALVAEERIVGVLLAIVTRQAGPGAADPLHVVRCNLSSLTVEAAYRPYAGRLACAALRHKDITFTNISPAPETRRVTEALGFRRFSSGQFLFVPTLNRSLNESRVALYDAAADAYGLSETERQLLSEHADFGCLCLVATRDGIAVPFIFAKRRTVRGLLPYRQLVYCRSLDTLAAFSGALGRFLLRRGDIFCLVDANGAVPGLKGRFFAGVGPKYFKGPCPPSPGDLAFTEIAVFGP